MWQSNFCRNASKESECCTAFRRWLRCNGLKSCSGQSPAKSHSEIAPLPSKESGSVPGSVSVFALRAPSLPQQPRSFPHAVSNETTLHAETKPDRRCVKTIVLRTCLDLIHHWVVGHAQSGLEPVGGNGHIPNRRSASLWDFMGVRGDVIWVRRGLHVRCDSGGSRQDCL
jgi:hypothetical protein